MKNDFPNSILPPLDIFELTSPQVRRYKNTIKSIKYFPVFWATGNNGNAPTIKEENDILKYGDTSSDELLSFDYGEWYSEDNNNIILECRSFQTLYNLSYENKEPPPTEPPPIKQSINYQELCYQVQEVVTLLQSCIQIP
jgi:hypothetical protein